MNKTTLLAKVYIALAFIAIILIVALFINKGFWIGFWMTLATITVFTVAMDMEFGLKNVLNGNWLHDKKGEQ